MTNFKLFIYANIYNLLDVYSTIIAVVYFDSKEVNMFFTYFNWSFTGFILFKIIFVLAWLNYVRRRSKQDDINTYMYWSIILFWWLAIHNLYILI